MTRWFYTDPLAVAWMQVHFGMKLTCPNSSGDVIHATVNRDTRVFNVGHLASPPFFKAYVHPDSAALLWTVVGDLVLLVADNRPMPCDSAELVEYITRRGCDWRIIQRDGKVFFMPECEE